MYWIAAGILILFVILSILARKEAAGEVSSLLKPFYRMSRYLYKRLCRRFPRLFSASQVEKDLLCLQPGRSGSGLKEEYYVKKAALGLIIIFLGTAFGAAARFSALEGRLLGNDGTVERGGYRDGSREISLTADYGEQRLDFRIDVEPRRMPEADAEAMFEEFLAGLPGFILGKNQSLQNVSWDLILTEKYGDYPMAVRWKSSRTDILSDEGRVSEVEKAENVTLLLHLQYGDWEREEELSVTLTPPQVTREEASYREFEDMLSRSQSQSREQEKWKLPMEWQGEEIGWREAVEDNSLALWMAALAAAGAVFYFLDRDLHEKVEKRKKNLRKEYPEIVHKLVLFAGAGMTIRGAFQRIAGEYEEKQQSRNGQSAAYEEVMYLCRELNSGVSEGLAYEHFGKRTGLQEYIRFTTLLAQNLKRGNSTLMDRLREEADKAAQERLQQSRRLGEEAGTKLLIPMVLMLAVVMAMIMIPAISNM
ncbi:MAG: hypothetical protein HFH91_08410 [Lachnospiraceae bacterium]|nr:hypothetical protein [Lachnospiraceae bacterium]